MHEAICDPFGDLLSSKSIMRAAEVHDLVRVGSDAGQGKYADVGCGASDAVNG